MCHGSAFRTKIKCISVAFVIVASMALSAAGAAVAASSEPAPPPPPLAAAAAAGTAAEAAAAGTAAGSAASAVSPEQAWFEKHVASRCFSPEDATWQLADGAKETVLHRQTQFFGLYEEPEGFYYHYSTTTKQTEFEIHKDARALSTKPQRQSNVYRCQYGVRRSTKAVFGVCFPSTATGVPDTETPVPWPFTVYATTLKLLNEHTLQQTFSTLPPYEDLLAATASGVKPGRQEMVITYILDSASGKAAMTTKISAYEVDPDSLQPRFVGTHEPGLEQQVRCDAR